MCAKKVEKALQQNNVVGKHIIVIFFEMANIQSK